MYNTIYTGPETERAGDATGMSEIAEAGMRKNLRAVYIKACSDWLEGDILHSSYAIFGVIIRLISIESLCPLSMHTRYLKRHSAFSRVSDLLATCSPPLAPRSSA